LLPNAERVGDLLVIVSTPSMLPIAHSRIIAPVMKSAEFDELAFFRALETNNVRALLIERRALVVLGLPVLTADYDLWLELDDIERLNTTAAAFDLVPTRTAEEARQRGRYVLENDEHIDVIVARAVPTVDGRDVAFRDLWARRQRLVLADSVTISLPTIDDLILTKQFSARPKDLEDIRLLTILKAEDRS